MDKGLWNRCMPFVISAAAVCLKLAVKLKVVKWHSAVSTHTSGLVTVPTAERPLHTQHIQRTSSASNHAFSVHD